MARSESRKRGGAERPEKLADGKFHVSAFSSFRASAIKSSSSDPNRGNAEERKYREERADGNPHRSCFRAFAINQKEIRERESNSGHNAAMVSAQTAQRSGRSRAAASRVLVLNAGSSSLK